MLSSVFLFLNIGTGEMVLIIFAALMLFGGEKLPEIARGLGKGIRDFKDASEDVKREINNQINSYEEKKADDKLNEIAAMPAQEPVEGVAGTLPAYEGYSATDAVEEHTEFHNPEAPETYSHNEVELQHPVTGQHDMQAATAIQAQTDLTNHDAPHTYSHHDADAQHPVTGQHDTAVAATKEEEPITKAI